MQPVAANRPHAPRARRAAWLLVKLGGLFAVGYAFFPLLKGSVTWSGYFVFVAGLTLLLTATYWLLSPPRGLVMLFGLWSIGTVVYLLIALPLAFAGVSPSPMLHGLNLFERILYSFLRPIGLLGVLAAGLTFMRITSPIEFLAFGAPGYWMAVLFRAQEFAGQELRNTQIVLSIQGEWPDADEPGPRRLYLTRVFRSGPILVSTAFRNVLIWGPWAYLCFRKLKRGSKGGPR